MNLVAPFTFDMLGEPWVLLLLVVVALLLLAEIINRAPGALSLSTGDVLHELRSVRSRWLRRIPALLRAVGLSCLVIALARPLDGYQIRKDREDIVDIMLALDVSGSMEEPDFVSNGQPRDRLFVAKEAVRDFIEGRRGASEERYGVDRVGLVLYAGFAWTQCPLTLDYDVLLRELDEAYVDQRDRRKEGTAIGSALGLAVRRLSQSEAKSKVIILLTDGLNNRGELDPLTAATVAKEYGIRAYTIGAGSPTARQSGFGFFARYSQPIDEETLKRVAEITGGRYYRATDMESLQEAYAEINALERTEVEVGDYYEYKEAFMPWVGLGAIAVLVSIFARRQWFEPIP